ncbi:MAG: RluA family pseudouridine synthase [Planctomycetota bacterium]|nr:RluA family pseudouridine synthase [Planctomycetota bacterium]
METEQRFSIPKSAAGERLDLAFLSSMAEISRSRAQAWIRAGRVEVDSVVVKRPGFRVEEGQEVLLRAEERIAKGREGAGPALELLYEDEAVVVVFKPPGLLTHGNRPGDRSVSGMLEESYGELPEGSEEGRAGIVHRLDRDTSGALVVARTSSALTALQAAFKERRVQKTYEAVVFGEPRFDSDWIEAPLGRHPKFPDRQSVLSEGEGREALTYWEVMERFDGLAHLSLSPKTGRTHQLRAHLASIELPILRDSVYRGRGGHTLRLPEEAPEIHRHALHASVLCFPHPTTGEEVSVKAPLPEDMGRVLEWLRSERSHS